MPAPARRRKNRRPIRGSDPVGFVLRKYDRRRGEYVFYRSRPGGHVEFGQLQMADTFEHRADAVKTAAAHSDWLDVIPKSKGA